MFAKNILAALLIGSVNLSAQVSYIDYLSPFHPTIGQSGMVVSQNQASSDIGIQILDMGGNAVDAAVAVGFWQKTRTPSAAEVS